MHARAHARIRARMHVDLRFFSVHAHTNTHPPTARTRTGTTSTTYEVTRSIAGRVGQGAAAVVTEEVVVAEKVEVGGDPR